MAGLQAQAQSQVRGGHLAGRGGPLREGSEAARAQEDTAEAFRRHIYVQGLYAKPLGEQQCSCSSSPPPPLAGTCHTASQLLSMQWGSSLQPLWCKSARMRSACKAPPLSLQDSSCALLPRGRGKLPANLQQTGAADGDAG